MSSFLPFQAMQLGRAMAGFAASGFRRVPDEILRQREGICHACEHWDPSAFAGTGRCKKCGCSCWKLHFPRSACPMGEWSAVTLS